MQKIKGKHIQVHVASYNETPKQDQHKLRQTSETISLLRKATNTLEKGTVALGLRAPANPPQDANLAVGEERENQV